MSEDVKETGPRTAKKVTGVERTAALEVLTDTNPKRAGSASFDRFEGYLTEVPPTTVQEAIDNGLTMGDIHYDIIHGSIEVEGAEVVEYEIKPRGPRSESSDEAEEPVTEGADDEDEDF